VFEMAANLPAFDVAKPGVVTYINGDKQYQAAYLLIAQVLGRGEAVLIADCNSWSLTNWDEVVLDGDPLIDHPLVRWYEDNYLIPFIPDPDDPSGRTGWAGPWETLDEAARRATAFQAEIGSQVHLVVDFAEDVAGSSTPDRWMALAAARPEALTLVLGVVPDALQRARLKEAAAVIIDFEDHANKPPLDLYDDSNDDEVFRPMNVI
jgi:hypothetical protein